MSTDPQRSLARWQLVAVLLVVVATILMFALARCSGSVSEAIIRGTGAAS